MLRRACKTCHIEKPLIAEFWHARKDAPDGFRSDCKPCRLESVSARNKERLADPVFVEHQKRKSREWYEANKDRNRAATKLWVKNNPERHRAYLSQPKVKEARKEYDQRVKANDPDYAEKRRAKSRLWYQANTERGKAYAKSWQSANPERYKLIARVKISARRAREKAAEGTYAVSDIEAQLEIQGHSCFWCSRDISDGRHTVDHYVPLSRGGSNWPSNIVVACKSCNSSKHNKLPEEFLSYLAARKAA